MRLKSFTIEQLPSLLPFIKTNVDMALTQEHQDVVWWHTGMNTKYLIDHMCEELDIKLVINFVKLISNKLLIYEKWYLFFGSIKITFYC